MFASYEKGTYSTLEESKGKNCINEYGIKMEF
jgi:hypothetical protein